MFACRYAGFDGLALTTEVLMAVYQLSRSAALSKVIVAIILKSVLMFTPFSIFFIFHQTINIVTYTVPAFVGAPLRVTVTVYSPQRNGTSFASAILTLIKVFAPSVSVPLLNKVTPLGSVMATVPVTFAV